MNDESTNGGTANAESAAPAAAVEESTFGVVPVSEVPEAIVVDEAVSDADAADLRAPIETWRKKHLTPDWLFAGAKLGLGWGIGQELSEKDYVDGVTWARDVASR